MGVQKPGDDVQKIDENKQETVAKLTTEVQDSAAKRVDWVVESTGELVDHTLNEIAHTAEDQEGSTLNQRITSLVQYFRRWSYSAGKVIMPDIIDIVSRIVNDKTVVTSFDDYEDCDNCRRILEEEFTDFESTLKANDQTIREQLAKWRLTPKSDGVFLDTRWIDSTFTTAIEKFNTPQRKKDARTPEIFREGQLKALRSTLSRYVDGDVGPIVAAINDGSFKLATIKSQLIDHKTTPATSFILKNCPAKGFRKIPKREDFKGEAFDLEKSIRFEKNPGLTVVKPTDDPQQLPKGVMLDANFGYKKDGSKRLPAHIMIIDDHEGFGERVFDTATVQLLDTIKEKGGLDSSYQDENGEYQVMVKEVDADTIIASWILKNLDHPLLKTSEFRRILRSISICEDFKLGSTVLEYGVKARDYVYLIHGMLEQTIEAIKKKKREKLEKEIADEEEKVALAGNTGSEKLEKLRGYLSWVNTTPLENDDLELVLSIMHQALPAIITTPFAFDGILQKAYRDERETYDQISQSYAAGEVEMAVSMYDKDLLVISRAGGNPLPEFKNRQGLYIFLRGQEQFNRELVLTKDGDSYDLSTNAENMKSLLKYDFKILANRVKTAEQVYVSHLIGRKKNEIAASNDPEKTKLLEYELGQLQRHFQLNKEGGVWRSRTQNLACTFTYLPEHDTMRIIVDWKKESIGQQKKRDAKTPISSPRSVDDLTAIEGRKLKVSKDQFNALFDNYSYTPESLVALFEEDFGAIFDADVQTPQFDTLRDHILQVLHQYEVYFSYNNLPAGVSPRLIRLTLLLHDIGKPAAVMQGQKHLQHAETLPILKSTFKALGFSESEVALASALVEEDPIGKYILDEGSLEDCIATLRSQAGKTSLSLRDFYELSMMFYMCDSSAYTSKPKPGKPSPLDKLYLLDEDNRVISIAPSKEQKVDELNASIETYSRLDEISSIESLEDYIEANKVRVQQQAERITKGDLNRQMSQMKSLFSRDQRNANAVAWYVYNYMNHSMEDPAREPSLANIAACLADEDLMGQAVQAVRKICAEENMDLQFNLMTLFFNSNPSLYVATMKRMTFEIPAATSKAGTDAKIDRLLMNYPGKTLFVAHQLADRLEREIIPKMLDTHATDLSGLLKMIGSGGIKYAKEIGYRYVDRKGDDFKLAGSLAVFTYMGALLAG